MSKYYSIPFSVKEKLQITAAVESQFDILQLFVPKFFLLEEPLITRNGLHPPFFVIWRKGGWEISYALFATGFRFHILTNKNTQTIISSEKEIFSNPDLFFIHKDISQINPFFPQIEKETTLKIN